METKDVCFTNKQRAEADHAAGEETRKRACRGPRETKKWKGKAGNETKSRHQSKTQEEMLAMITAI